MGPVKKPDCALALAAGGRPLKTVCEVLGVARSGLAVKQARDAGWHDGRRARMPMTRSCSTKSGCMWQVCRAMATGESGRCCDAAEKWSARRASITRGSIA